MTKDELVDSAKQLTKPDKAAFDDYSAQKEVLASKVVEAMKQRPDLNKLIGEDNSSMMNDNAHNMARFMESVFLHPNPDTFVETILWVFRAYRSHGFQLTFWSAHLNTWLEVLKEELSVSSFNDLRPFYEWIQTNIPSFSALTDT